MSNIGRLHKIKQDIIRKREFYRDKEIAFYKTNYMFEYIIGNSFVRYINKIKQKLRGG